MRKIGRIMGLICMMSLFLLLSCEPDAESMASDIEGTYNGSNNAKAQASKAIAARVIISEVSSKEVRVVCDNRNGGTEVVFPLVKVSKSGDQYILKGENEDKISTVEGAITGDFLELIVKYDAVPAFIFEGTRDSY